MQAVRVPFSNGAGQNRMQATSAFDKDTCEVFGNRLLPFPYKLLISGATWELHGKLSRGRICIGKAFGKLPIL